jgi:CheY-like chemotaxis protein
VSNNGLASFDSQTEWVGIKVHQRGQVIVHSLIGKRLQRWFLRSIRLQFGFIPSIVAGPSHDEAATNRSDYPTTAGAEEPKKVEQIEPRTMPAAPERRTKKGIRVVIADDEAKTRRSLKTLLTVVKPEIEVVGEAANGQEAVQQAERTQPDVVLMDARMSTMDGLEATRHIKAQWPKIKVIFLTMHMLHPHAAHAAGADAFLIKGCAAEELVNTIVNTAGRSN